MCLFEEDLAERPGTDRQQVQLGLDTVIEEYRGRAGGPAPWRTPAST
jgi:hypothetical protein